MDNEQNKNSDEDRRKEREAFLTPSIITIVAIIILGLAAILYRVAAAIANTTAIGTPIAVFATLLIVLLIVIVLKIRSRS